MRGGLAAQRPADGPGVVHPAQVLRLAERPVHRPAERPAGAAVWSAVHQRAEWDGLSGEDQPEG